MIDSNRDEALAIAQERLPGWAYAMLRHGTVLAKADPLPPAAPANEPAPVVPDAAPKRGLMVALMLPPDVAAKLAQDGGEPANRLHCTLAYPGKVEDLPSDALDRVKAAVEKVCAEFAPFVGLIGGVGRFNASGSSDGKDVLHATLDAPVLPALQQAIMSALDTAKLPPKREHGFDPHITLAYQDKGSTAPLPRFDTMPAVFDSLAIVAGDERIADVPLKGTRIYKGAPEISPVIIEQDQPSVGDVHVAGPMGNVRDRLDELVKAGLSREAARVRVREELKGTGISREQATELVAQAAIAKARPMSREYLEEAWTLARKKLPAWALATIHQEAMPRSGGRAAHRPAEKARTSTIQSLIFDKSKFTEDEAKRWATDHDYENGKVDETEDSFRLRQEEPGRFNSFRTIELTDGVKAVLGIRGDKRAAVELAPALPASELAAGGEAKVLAPVVQGDDKITLGKFFPMPRQMPIKIDPPVDATSIDQK